MRPKGKFAVIHRHREDYPISVMCRFFEVSRSGYYDFVCRIGKPEKDAELAEEIRQKMFVFEDIVHLDSMSIQAFIPQVEPKDLAIAIKGSTAEVAEVIYANMSARSKESTQTDVEYLHNVRMRDVEEAQQRIVSIIRRLEDEGKLTISKGGSDEIIA